MKKTLLLTAALFCSYFFAQQLQFSGNYSTKSLKEIQKTIPQDQKHAFYKQYFRVLITEEMKSQFLFKNYSDAGLRIFTDSVIAGNTAGGIETTTPEAVEILAKIDKNFLSDSANTFTNYHLLAENSGLFPGQRFPDVSSEAKESSIYETLPGEILTYVTETGYSIGRNFISYKISGLNLEQLNPYPNDSKFDKKVSKYAKKGWRFEPRAGYSIEKNKSGEYIVSTSVYTAQDFNTAPSMSIEYKTKDFKNFTPLRIAKNEDENLVWKEIK